MTTAVNWGTRAMGTASVCNGSWVKRSKSPSKKAAAVGVNRSLASWSRNIPLSSVQHLGQPIQANRRLLPPAKDQALRKIRSAQGPSSLHEACGACQFLSLLVENPR
jgi:hypothetical protein